MHISTKMSQDSQPTPTGQESIGMSSGPKNFSTIQPVRRRKKKDDQPIRIMTNGGPRDNSNKHSVSKLKGYINPDN